jgi:hypothetical protein
LAHRVASLLWRTSFPAPSYDIPGPVPKYRAKVGVLSLMFKAQRQVRLRRDAVELVWRRMPARKLADATHS